MLADLVKKYWFDLLIVALLLGLAGACSLEHSKAEVAVAKQHGAEKASAELTQQLVTQQVQDNITAKVEASAAAAELKTETVYRNINHEVIRYVQSPATPGCALDRKWVRLYNAAAAGTAPAESSGPVHDASSPAAAAE